MNVPVSVITCAHNPRPGYLAQVIKALRAQTLATDSWEYLLVDNASAEPLESRIDLSRHPHARHVTEPKLGLTQARLRGISEASAELLVFVDDDNVLDTDYLEEVLKVGGEWPRLGSWSGQTRPGFEAPPPEWTRRYWGNLVIRSLDADVWSNLPNLPETMPCGAGLCVRRDVAAHYWHLHSSGQRKFVLDRAGQSLLSGGDNDLAACACDIGLGVGLFSSLRLTHLIPVARLEEQYLLSLVENIAYSGVIFRSFRSTGTYQERWTRRLADFARQFMMNRRDRRFFLASRRGEWRAVQYLKEHSSSVKAQSVKQQQTVA